MWGTARSLMFFSDHIFIDPACTLNHTIYSLPVRGSQHLAARDLSMGFGRSASHKPICISSTSETSPESGITAFARHVSPVEGTFTHSPSETLPTYQEISAWPWFTRESRKGKWGSGCLARMWCTVRASFWCWVRRWLSISRGTRAYWHILQVITL